MKPPARAARQPPVRTMYERKCAIPSWTIEEKRQLLHALRTQATLDPAVLQEYLPNKTSSEIHSVVKTYLLRGQMNGVKVHSAMRISKQEEAAEKWLTKCKEQLGSGPDFSRNASTVLDALALMEDDSPPFSYSQVYAYLSAVLRGMKSMYLQPEDSFLLLELLKDLAHTAETRDTFRQVAHLREKFMTPVVSESVPQRSQISGSPAVQPGDAEHAGDREDTVATSATTTTCRLSDGTTTSTGMQAESVLPTAAAAAAVPSSVVARSRLQTPDQGVSTSTGMPVNRLPPLAARMASNPFDLDLQRIKSLNPLDIPAFLMQLGCKPADISEIAKAKKQARFNKV